MKKAFDRVLIVMFENQYRNYVMQDPLLSKLSAAGANMTNYFGAFHPSQTNYLASLAAEVCAVTNDTPPIKPLMQQTLVDVLEPAGVSWKAYMEGYPGDPWKAAWQDPNYPASDQPLTEFPKDGELLARYFRKHNAFASFHTIQASQSRWSKIVSEVEFWDDVAGSSLPEYAWFTPDIWNDGHYLYNTHTDTDPRTKLVPQISGWLEYVFFGDIAASHVQGGAATNQPKLGLAIDVDLLLRDPAAAWKKSRVPSGTLIVVTFDEADYDATEYDTNYDGPNQIYTVLLGDMIEPGTVIDTPLNHYSLIKTIQKNFGTDNLGKNDRDANWIRLLWGESFAWSDPSDVGLETAGNLALAADDGGACLVFDDGNGVLASSRFDGSKWSAAEATGLNAGGPIALAGCEGQLHLICADKDGQLFAATREANGSWTDAAPLGQRTAGSIAAASYLDDADGQNKIMLCWQSANGFIEYLIYAGGAWQREAGAVGQLTDGPMALAQMGPSLLLVYKERNTRKMRITSYNLAPFNAFDAVNFQDQPAPENNTSLHEWAPADFYVGHFAKKMAALQNDYQALGNLAMATIEGAMHLVHRGGYADMPSAYTEIFGLTGVFTAANPLTNGFGTLDQAGWTLEQEWPAVQLDPSSGIAMCSSGRELLLVWRAAGGNGLKYCAGGYHNL